MHADKAEDDCKLCDSMNDQTPKKHKHSLYHTGTNFYLCARCANGVNSIFVSQSRTWQHTSGYFHIPFICTPCMHSMILPAPSSSTYLWPAAMSLMRVSSSQSTNSAPYTKASSQVDAKRDSWIVLCHNMHFTLRTAIPTKHAHGQVVCQDPV